MSEIYQLPESNGGNNATIPFSIPIGIGGYGNGFGNGLGGFNSIADLFGLAIIASMFGCGIPFSPTTSGTDFLKKELESSENVGKQ